MLAVNEPGAVRKLAGYCAHAIAGSREPVGNALLVADARTWEAAGRFAGDELRRDNVPFRSFVFPQTVLGADAASIFALLAGLRETDRILVAAGSGTITDIVRFVCAKTGRRFISFPTAPSVDAYASSIAALVEEGVKRTFPAIAPEAIFADPGILSAAPRPMIAAGFGDMVCKFSAVADWRLGSLLWDEPYDDRIAERSLASARVCCQAAGAIGRAEAEGIGVLIASLVDSGLCMAEAGHSRSASGAEHHYSHFWEMKLMREGRPPILHGLKVASSTLITAGLWERIRSMKAGDARAMIARRAALSREAEEASIRAVFGSEAGSILASQETFLSLRGERLDRFADKVVSNWGGVRKIAAGVPGVDEIRSFLGAAGCPVDPRDLGLREEDIDPALAHAHWLRDRFTVRKLVWLLDGR